MLIHQDASTHAWVPDEQWDLVVTMDDATSEVYSGFFVEEEGTFSSFRGVQETISQKGLFSSIYTDRGSHYWLTPVAGGKVDKQNLTQFGRAMQQLGIQMIAAYSPEAHGRSERLFRTLQRRLPQELAEAGITTREAANAFLSERFWLAFNRTFQVAAREEGDAFVPLLGVPLEDILCVQVERTVGRDNCITHEGRKLQIPADEHRCHYVKARVRVHSYADGSSAVFHGPRKLASYDVDGNLVTAKKARRKAA